MQNQINLFLVIILQCVGTYNTAQQVIDSNFTIEGQDKKYSLYVPSTHDDTIESPLMLGLHPLNTSRWDSESWRDTLINFAESNNLILVCPDGGPDGRIDDPIDTLFTSALMDSVSTWFNIDETKKYIMGFSWGGKTTYTYGLRRTNEFNGYLAIGAAINGVNEVNDIIQNAEGENFYLVHGSLDNADIRYSQIKEALIQNDACVESTFMNGVGHTIDFPNRDAILTEAYVWLTINNCDVISGVKERQDVQEVNFYPNPNPGIFYMEDKQIKTFKSIEAYSISGVRIPMEVVGNKFLLKNRMSGIVILKMTTLEGIVQTSRIIVYP